MLQGLKHRVGVVSGIDQIDVMGPLIDQLVKNLPQTGDGNGGSEAPVADGLVLTKDTAQGAAGEKHRA